jgi:putative Holliday junction resolvase
MHCREELLTLQTLLGFDYGTRRIGIAVGQSITGTASALCTISARQGRPDWEKITALVDEWQPDSLVVGLPLHDDGSESDMSRAARKFARQLQVRYQRPVHTINERLSSHAASQLLQDSSGRQGVDAVAAMIILQNWLEQANT